MVEEFSFGNFRSFKEIQTLRLRAAKIKSKDENMDVNHVISNGDLQLLKSKAIYGANASGKSNIVKALVAFIVIIRDSVKNDNILRSIDSFKLSTDTVQKPTFFQLIFRIGNIRYRYGFEADSQSIKSEWLFATPNKREQALYIRENNELLEVNQTHFKEGVLYQKLFENAEDQIFTNTSLFLTHLHATGFAKISKEIYENLKSIAIISGLGNWDMYGIDVDYLKEKEKKDFTLDFLKKADVGIDNLKLVLQSEGEQTRQLIFTTKTTFDSNLTPKGKTDFLFLNHESEGTKKMFELSPFIYRSLKNGGLLVIDEFDARFHPLLTKKIVALYNSAENKKAQLVFTTHDTNLLSANVLRRDQIDFVEKDKYGASHLYSLVEMKGVRNDASFEKDYIQGKYGAIPFLGDFTSLIVEE